jgi:TrmH family RNA methyltransferase
VLQAYLLGLREADYRVACASLDGQPDFTLDAEKTCLVIGNEARGISEEIFCLCDVRVRIPIYGKAESLNAAVAAGILIYKIRS